MPDTQQPSPSPKEENVSPQMQQGSAPVSTPVNNGFDPNDAKSILDILYAEHALTKQQYEDVKVRCATEGLSPAEVIKSMNIVPEEKIAEALAHMLGIPYISLSNVSFSPQAIGLLPKAVVDRFVLIPFMYEEKTKTLSIAMSNPIDLDAIAFVRQKTGMNVKSFAAAPSEVKDSIEQQYRQELVGEVGAAIKETEEFKNRTVDSKQIAQIISDAPIAKIVSTILEYAVNSRSSDVHVEPLEDKVRVRYRIDGILYDKLSLPKNVQNSLISRIKIIAELKIDEHRIPQDGRFNFKVDKREVDIRVSILPTVKGEKIAMRLLPKTGGIPSLAELGLGGLSLKNLETSILRPHGIIIVCGPTGSGKTTTLYSVLARLNTARVNIASLEDPVEYEIPGVNQVQVNPAVGLTFASGLRSFLRQDPNIILVGEIRDKETADLAIQAALTGHLVFSTLHTSSSAGTLPRLVDLGAETFLLASTVNAIVAQRIVRQICLHCKEAYVPPQELVDEIKRILGNLFPAQNQTTQTQLYRGKGCEECGNLGYKGRIGIYEVLPVSERISRLILERKDEKTIVDEAVSEGMITMRQDGYLKVLRGQTTIEEVLRVAQE